jgi:integrase
MTALRPGELFARRWSDLQPNQLRVGDAVRRVRRGESKIGPTKTENSNGFVALPNSLMAELSHWKSVVNPADDDQLIFRSRNGTPKDSHNYLRRHLQPLASKLGVEGVTFQALRRTFATLIQGLGTPKDAQTQLRHVDISTTMNVYTQSIPESVIAAVEALDKQFSAILHDSARESKAAIQ